MYKDVIRNGRKISTHVYQHTTLHSAWLKHNKGKELIRCGVTRFATNFLTLESLFECKSKLRSFDWEKWAKKGHGLDVSDLIINTRFWITLEDLLRASQPILVVLRMVHGDTKPTMPYLVGAFEAARIAVKTNFDDDKSKYKPIWNLMDKRWAKHYQSPLMKAGGFLNPRVFYNLQRSNPELASTCQEAFEDCVARMIPDVHQQIKVLVDSSLYINKAGRFSSEVAELAVEDLEPIRWWEHFGSRTPELRTYAMRIIGLCCSASSCERNWSTFEHFHTRRRNRLKIEQLDDLVFVNYNKKLEERLQRNIMLEEDGKGKFDPIRLEELNLTSEWITDIEGESEEFVYTEEGLTWSMVEGAAGEHPGLSTRSGQARPFTTQAPFSSEVCERFRRTYQRSKRRMQPRMLEEIEEEE